MRMCVKRAEDMHKRTLLYRRISDIKLILLQLPV